MVELTEAEKHRIKHTCIRCRYDISAKRADRGEVICLNCERILNKKG